MDGTSCVYQATVKIKDLSPPLFDANCTAGPGRSSLEVKYSTRTVQPRLPWWAGDIR